MIFLWGKLQMKHGSKADCVQHWRRSCSTAANITTGNEDGSQRLKWTIQHYEEDQVRMRRWRRSGHVDSKWPPPVAAAKVVDILSNVHTDNMSSDGTGLKEHTLLMGMVLTHMGLTYLLSSMECIDMCMMHLPLSDYPACIGLNAHALLMRFAFNIYGVVNIFIIITGLLVSMWLCSNMCVLNVPLPDYPACIRFNMHAISLRYKWG